jgi:hypothetical protein
MKNGYTSSGEVDKNKIVLDTFLVMIVPIILFIGTVFNIISLIVFLNSKFKNSVYFYIIIHTILDTVYCIGAATSMQIDSDSWIPKRLLKSYSYQLYGLYVKEYLTSSMAIFITLIELVISLQRLSILTNGKFLKDTRQYKIIIVLSIFSLLSYTQEVIFFKVNPKNGTNESYYEISYNEIGERYKLIYEIISIVVQFFRGPFCLILAFIINIKLWLEFKKYVSNKCMLRCTYHIL